MDRRRITAFTVITLLILGTFGFASDWSGPFTGFWETRASAAGAKSQTAKPMGMDAPETVVLNTDFEGGAGPWLFANNATNQWVVGSAAAAGGVLGAYISNNGGAANAYTNSSTQVSHMYTPVNFPAGETAIRLSFDWRGVGEHSTNNWDYVRISTTAAAPVAGTIPAAADQIPVVYNAQVNFTRGYITLPASLAGTTRNLVFTWVNDASGGTTAPAIDNIQLITETPVALTGAKSVPGDYASIGDAINNLNAHGVGVGGVTFNVAAGSTFNETPPSITASGSPGNLIVFRKTGVGANPILSPQGTGNLGPTQTVATSGTPATGDAGIVIQGGDFITFDGIDVASQNYSGTTTAMEYGFLVKNISATNGAQSNIIRNTSITLSRTNTLGAGIMQSASTIGGGVAPTNASGTNSGNRYQNFTIQNSYTGVHLAGTAAFPDDLNEIGVTGAVTQNTIGAATANDIGFGPSQTWGIRANAQSNIKIFNNEIRNITGTSTAAVDGIFMENTTGNTVSVGTNEIYNNNVHDIGSTSTSATSHVVAGIRVNQTANAASVSRVYNNFVYGLNNASTNTASRQIIGLRIQDGGSGAGSTHNIVNNSVRIAPAGLSCQNTALEIGTTSGPIMNIRNNILANFTAAQAGAAKHYTWVTTSTTLTGAAGSISNNNVLFNSGTTNGFIGLTNATDRATLGDWQTAVSQDANSFAQNPQFVSASNLHIQTGIATPAEGNAVPVAFVTNDIDNDVRNVTTPDIGADEGNFIALLANDIAATGIIAPSSPGIMAVGSIPNPQAAFTNAGTATQTSVSVQFTINGPGGYAYSDTQVIASIASSAIANVSFAAAPTLTTPGAYTMTASVITPDSNAANDSVGGGFTAAAPFSGNVNVGVGQDYTSLTNPGGIFDAINVVGTTAAVQINIVSDMSGETGVVPLNQIASGFAVIIQSAGGVRTVSGSNATALITINGADRVTFSGVNFGGQSLTIRNVSSAAGGVIRYINDSSNNIINSCNLEQNNINSSVVVYGAGTTTGNDDNVISDSRIAGTSPATPPFNGVASVGTSAAISNTNLTVRDNTIIDFGQAGILMGAGTDAYDILRNDISQSAPRTTAISGISLGSGASAGGSNMVQGNRIHNLISGGSSATRGILVGDAATVYIESNMIYDIQTVPVATGPISGIESVGISGGTPSTNINNNFVSITPTNTSAQVISGIYDFGFAGNSFVAQHNSIYIGGTGSGSAASWALRRGTAAPTAFTSRNNIAFNNRTGGTSSHFAGGDQSANGGSFSSDGNLFAGTGATPANFMDYGTAAAGTPVSFAAWQAGPPARDAASAAGLASSFVVSDIWVDAVGGDLHLKPTAGLNILGAGNLAAGLSYDFDSDPRNVPTVTPDRGADELVQAQAGIVPAGTYYNAWFDGLAGDIVGGNVTINGTLYITGWVPLGANTVTFGCDAVVDNSNIGSYLMGNVAKTFCGTGTFTYPIGTSPNGSARGSGTEGLIGEYSPATIVVNSGTFPSSLTISAVDTWMPGLGQTSSLSRHWLVTETGDLNVDMTFQYLNEDVYGAEASYNVYRYNGSVPVLQTGSVNAAANTFTATNVTTFSPWGAGAIVPTAASVDIAGRVTTADGRPIRNVQVAINGDGLPEPMFVYTGNLGYYNFNDLPVGNYVLSINSKRFTFTNPVRVITLKDNIADVDFIALPQE